MKKQRDTGWHVYKDGIERRVVWKPGYDCRIKCEHEVRGDHGQSGDELSLQLRVDDVAVTLGLFTQVRDGKVIRPDAERLIEPAWTHMHYGFPVTREEIRAGGTGNPCDVLKGGKCWEGNGALVSRRLWVPSSELELGVLIAMGVEHTVLHATPDTWINLEAYLNKERAGLREEARPKQCQCCKGTGLTDV